MSKLGRSWTNGNNFRPARDVEIKYGKDLIKNESNKWPNYIVVTTKTSGKDFNDFILKCKKHNKKIGIFKIREKSWIDVGQMQEYKTNLNKDI